MKKTFQRFFKIIQPEKRQLSQIYSYAVFKGIIGLSLPLGIQSIINLIQGGQVSAAWFVLVFVIIGGIAFSGIFQLMQLRITENIQQRIFSHAVFDFAFRIPKIQFEDIGKYYPPELMNRFFEVPVLQKSISKVLVELPTAVLQILFGLVVLSFYHPFFISFSLLMLFLVVIIIVFTARQGLDTSIYESKQKFKAASWLEELARVKDTFKLAGKTDYPLRKINNLTLNYINARESHYSILRIQYIILLVFKISISAALLLVGGYLVIDQKMNIGQFVASEIILLLIIDSSEKLILNFDTIYDVLTSIEKISEVTDMKLEKMETGNSIVVDEKQGFQLELHEVNFKYPDNEKYVINNSNLVIKPGEIIGIHGVNGSGKSTLMHLMSGLYKPTSGNILINNLHIDNYNKEELYSGFGNGLSEETIFDGTLADNISLGRENVSNEAIMNAIENTGLSGYLKNLPDGLNTVLELSGSRLPESIYNKIILARSIVHCPKLLLIEIGLDTFEKLERKRIIDYLTRRENGWTLVFISNDEYFISKADRILKIIDGKIV